MQSLDFLRKNYPVTIPLIMVVLFDISLLVTNFIISDRLETDSININIAGRQRMLTQKVAKSLTMLHYNNHQEADISSDYSELLGATDLLDKTLIALTHGGIVTNAAGNLLELEPLTRPIEKHLLLQAVTVWEPLRTSIYDLSRAPLRDDEQINSIKLNYAIKLSNEHMESLLDLMNQLTVELENKATQGTYMLRGIQTAVVICILLSFFVASLRVIRRENYYDSLMEKSTDIVLSIDIRSDEVTFISQSVTRLLGHPQSYYLKQSIDRLFCPDTLRQVGHLLRHIHRYKKLPDNRREVRLVKANGDIITADMVMQIATSENGRDIELNADIRDISERKQAEELLTQMAHRDPLTGLPNRLLFFELAEQAIKEAQRRQQSLAIMFIDLDGFKLINDQFGHKTGDDLLIEVAHRLQQPLRSSDTVARFGGDEFLILLRDVKDMHIIESLGDTLIELLSTPIQVRQHPCQVSASIGVATFKNDGESVDKLIARADAAMYEAKNAGKNRLAYASQPLEPDLFSEAQS